MTPDGIPPGSRTSRAIIDHLLDARGMDRPGRALFLVQSEGVTLPGDLEAVSGYVLGRDGRVHRWWLSWSETGNDYELSPWAEVPDPVDAFGNDAGFRDAWSEVFGRMSD
ncbi:MAG: hypothetical protein EXR45_07070 [Chloroflexi bacterium]|nr:hypothetical protein [Chloroflexota bacterium]